MTDIVGNPATYPASHPCIDDGDPCSRAEHGATAQSLANAIEWLKLWTLPFPAVNVPLIPTLNTNTRFTLGHTNRVPLYSQSSVADGGDLSFPATFTWLPIGRQIIAVVAYWGNANVSAVPANKPSVQLYRQINTSSPLSSALIGSQVDPTTLLSAYQNFHTITLAGLTEVIEQNYQYSVGFQGESGANSATGGSLLGLRLILAP